MSLQISVMEITVASCDKIVGQLYERLEQLEELLTNRAKRTIVLRLVNDCVDLKSKVSKRNEIVMSSNVEAVVSEASASSKKVNDHCRFVLDSARKKRRQLSMGLGTWAFTTIKHLRHFRKDSELLILLSGHTLKPQ